MPTVRRPWIHKHGQILERRPVADLAHPEPEVPGHVPDAIPAPVLLQARREAPQQRLDYNQG